MRFSRTSFRCGNFRNRAHPAGLGESYFSVRTSLPHPRIFQEKGGHQNLTLLEVPAFLEKNRRMRSCPRFPEAVGSGEFPHGLETLVGSSRSYSRGTFQDPTLQPEQVAPFCLVTYRPSISPPICLPDPLKRLSSIHPLPAPAPGILYCLPSPWV